MTKIDETTGLAALPDDMFWRVEESVLNTGSSYRSVGAVKLLLMKKIVAVTESVTKFRDVPNGFWKRVYTGDRYTSVPYKTEPITKTGVREVRSTDFLLTAHEVPDGETGWNQYTVYDGWGDTEDRYYSVVPATAETLLKNSLSLWANHLNGQHQIALDEDARRDLEAILGDYPPKSVKDLVNA